jgi:NAD(P)-dependent dehydrogenase (short-subunit alcohol dehydrogenase family)
VYSSTKFAVEDLTEALHGELAPPGIHVTVVEPGYFRTDFLDPSSLVVSPGIIDDYALTSGAVRAVAATLNHRQPGDPLKPTADGRRHTRQSLKKMSTCQYS